MNLFTLLGLGFPGRVVLCHCRILKEPFGIFLTALAILVGLVLELLISENAGISIEVFMAIEEGIVPVL